MGRAEERQWLMTGGSLSQGIFYGFPIRSLDRSLWDLLSRLAVALVIHSLDRTYRNMCKHEWNLL